MKNACLTIASGLALVVIASTVSFAADGDADAAARKTQRRNAQFFEAKIRPILVSHCYDCHSENSDEIGGGLLVDSREGLLRGGESGPAVVPGSVKESLLISSLEFTDFEMPPTGKLPADVIRDFRRWIADGAFDPRASSGASEAEAEDESEERASNDLWSLRPLSIPDAPTAGSWAESDIDRFTQHAMKNKGLKPVSDASPESLLRRLSMDLTGLPPSPRIQMAFGKAAKTDLKVALTWFVDEQLSSPQFGERWGRHWMDAVRYAESAGNSRDVLMPWAWRYRDYIIDALNADVPYDRFITEQIAGDLLEPGSAEERDRFQVATGFLAIGSKSLNGGNLALDIPDDQIDVIGKAIVGLTISCARCHDHKFDPIPTADYYALAGIFRSTETLYGGSTRRPKSVSDKLKVYLPLGEDVEDRVKAISELDKRVAALTKQQTTLVKKIAQLRKRLPKDWQAQKKSLEARSSAQGEGTKKALDAKEKKLLTQLTQFTAAEKDLYDVRLELKSLKNDQMPELGFAVGVREAKKIADSPIHVRGEKDKTGDVVPRGFLTAVSISESIQVNKEQSGRLELSRWLTQPDHPLTTRVIVNRVWQHLFGRGLVETVDNFGVNGTPPSHPELLDWLAHRFVHEHGWSLKSLIREIVLSRTYRLSSEFDEQNYQKDPGNVFLWRASRRRLEAEPLRDSILAASGQLNLERPLGSAVMKIGEGEVGRGINTSYLEEPFPHRAVYLPIIRTKMNPFLKTFDHPEPSNPQGLRDATNVPAQSLYFMNSPFILEQTEHLAKRVLADNSEDAQRLEQLWRLTINRSPSGTEINRALEFLSSTDEKLKAEHPKSTEREVAAWSLLGQALFASAEFRYID